MTDSWVHVAIVNDPAAMTTTMCVDGAPVLRNALDTAGMTWNRGMPWILGADWVDDAARNGWNGCIGETRIIDHPTAADEWLTQRADLTGLALTSAPEGTLPADTESVAFAGTVLPGANVRVSVSVDAAGAAMPDARETAPEDVHGRRGRGHLDAVGHGPRGRPPVTAGSPPRVWTRRCSRSCSRHRRPDRPRRVVPGDQSAASALTAPISR